MEHDEATLGLRSEQRDSSESTNYTGPTHVVRTGDQRRETVFVAYKLNKSFKTHCSPTKLCARIHIKCNY